jgi:transformation/transcription domain-associated protein
VFLTMHVYLLPADFLTTHHFSSLYLSLLQSTKLTVPLLRGLSRLLSLLATWFNKTLGEKLLEHLRRWESVDKATVVGGWKSGEDPSIAASIISVFELLPQASSFTEALVSVVIRLESAFRHHSAVESSSPFRTPLVCFLNRYPSAAADYFLTSSSLTDNSKSLH